MSSDQFYYFQAGGGAVNVASHPDYIVAWEPVQTTYLDTEEIVLKWTVSRKDGQPVAQPVSAAIEVIRYDSNTPETLNVDIEASDDEVTQVLAATYTFAGPGTYLALLFVSLPSPDDASVVDQVRGQSRMLTVQDSSIPPPSFTYDLSTPIGKCRTYLGDTCVSAPIFTDAEIEMLLTDSQNNPKQNLFIAAANGYLTNAGSQAKVAVRIAVGSFKYEKLGVHAALLAMSREYREQAPVAPVCNPPDTPFTFTRGDDLGSMAIW